MTEGHSSDELEAIQVVVDRVSGYQDGAPEGTVLTELARGLAEADLGLTDDEVSRLAAAIEDQHGSVDAAAVLG
jgi:hypothetical protein